MCCARQQHQVGRPAGISQAQWELQLEEAQLQEVIQLSLAMEESRLEVQASIDAADRAIVEELGTGDAGSIAAQAVALAVPEYAPQPGYSGGCKPSAPGGYGAAGGGNAQEGGYEPHMNPTWGEEKGEYPQEGSSDWDVPTRGGADRQPLPYAGRYDATEQYTGQNPAAVQSRAESAGLLTQASHGSGGEESSQALVEVAMGGEIADRVSSVFTALHPVEDGDWGHLPPQKCATISQG